MWFLRRHPVLSPDAHTSGGAPGFPAPAAGHVPCQKGERLNVLLSWGGWRSDSWADRVACLLEPMGVSSHKACTARQAERVIRSVPVHIAVVDLGLPMDEQNTTDEAGARVLELLRRLHNPPPTVIVSSPASQRAQSRDMAAALRADAFAVVDRRSADVECMLKVLQRAMERFYCGRWPSGGSGGGAVNAPATDGSSRQRGPLSFWYWQ